MINSEHIKHKSSISTTKRLYQLLCLYVKFYVKGRKEMNNLLEQLIGVKEELAFKEKIVMECAKNIDRCFRKLDSKGSSS